MYCIALLEGSSDAKGKKHREKNPPPSCFNVDGNNNVVGRLVVIMTGFLSSLYTEIKAQDTVRHMELETQMVQLYSAHQIFNWPSYVPPKILGILKNIFAAF